VSIIRFTVPSVPVAQPRPRAGILRGHARIYKDNTHPVHAFKACVQMAAREVYQDAPLDGPLGLRAAFVMPRPQRLTKKRGPNDRCWCPTRPDLDNLEKALKDALTGILWRDDAQVADVSKWKVYSSAAEQPCVEVEIRSLDGRTAPWRIA
jgi:Holliday junction resolvase RusA-like endonuclease